MKAISLWEPWATYIKLGHKTIETRHWDTNVRGLIAIHAAKRFEAIHEIYSLLNSAKIPILTKADCASGAIIAVGNLYRIRPTFVELDGSRGMIIDATGSRVPVSIADSLLGNFNVGRFAWFLKDVRPLKSPLPWRGKQGWFEVPDEIMGSLV